MSATYSTVTQLVPASSFTMFQMLSTTILGNTTKTCAQDQTVLLWLAAITAWITCFVSSLTADSTVTYAPAVSKTLGTNFEKLCPARIVHPIMSTLALAVVILVQPVVFDCLTGVQLEYSIINSVPIMVSTSLVSVYTFLFHVPPPTTATV